MRARTKWIIGASAVLLVSAAAAWALPQGDQTARKEEKIRRLLEVTGAGNLGKQMVHGMLEQFRNMPNLPDGFVARFMQEIKPGELVDLIVPIYSKHFTEEDLDGLLAFYATPLGQKLIRMQPQILNESMEAGQKWGEEVALRVLKELQREK